MGSMIRAVTVLVAAAYGMTAQTDAGLDLWVRVRQHVRAGLAELPNYTCQEAMERVINDPAGKIEFRERLRLDVLVTPSQELFAWPGSTGFTTDPIDSWIGTGAIGNGTFAAELHNLFLASTATVKYGGLETRDRQNLYRFDFHTPLLGSRYRLTVNGKSATTAYSGSFWVNKESLDIVRLERRAEEIPTDLDCREAHESVIYDPIDLGVTERLLPSAAELVIVARDGSESRNTIAFSQCRHYTVEASLSFDTTSDPKRLSQPNSRQELPAGVTLPLRLEQPISFGESAVGDDVQARLDKAVRLGSMLLPKGTLVLGRIRRLEQHFSKPVSNLIGLQFFAAQTPGGRIIFSARLIGPRAIEEVVRVVGDKRGVERGVGGIAIEDSGTSTGIGTFRVPARDRRLLRGFHTIWETR